MRTCWLSTTAIQIKIHLIRGLEGFVFGFNSAKVYSTTAEILMIIEKYKASSTKRVSEYILTFFVNLGVLISTNAAHTAFR